MTILGVKLLDRVIVDMLGKCSANRNVLRYVQILAQWVFMVGVIRWVEA